MDGHDRMRALFDEAAGHAPDTGAALEELGPRFTAARRRRQAAQGALALAAVLGVVGAGAVLWQPDTSRTVVAVVPTSDDTPVTGPSSTAAGPVTTTPTSSVPAPVTSAPSVTAVPPVTSPPPVTTAAPGGASPTAVPPTTATTGMPTTAAGTPPAGGTAPTVPAAPGAPTSGPGGATSTSTPGPTTVGSTPGSALPAPAERTAVCAGGSVRARWTGTTMQVVAVTPVAGATVEETIVDDDEVEVRFRLVDARTSRAWVEIDDGAVVTDCDDD